MPEDPEGEPNRLFLVSMILGTYRELPGLTLHVNQAARLFGLRIATCRIILNDLVRAGQLRRAADGQYTGS
jgi:DNA-binding IclR family transcriptional regulator